MQELVDFILCRLELRELENFFSSSLRFVLAIDYINQEHSNITERDRRLYPAMLLALSQSCFRIVSMRTAPGAPGAPAATPVTGLIRPLVFVHDSP